MGVIIPMDQEGIILLLLKIALNSFIINDGYFTTKHANMSLLKLSIPVAFPGFSMQDAVFNSAIVKG